MTSQQLKEETLVHTGARASLVGSSYRFSRLLPVSTNGNIVLTPSEQLLTFNLPAQNVFNLSKSSISFDYLQASNGGGNHSVNFVDAVPFSKIRLIGPNETLLCELNSADVYSKVVSKACTPLEEYLQRHPCRAEASVGTSVSSNSYQQPANIVFSTAAAGYGRYSRYVFDNASNPGASNLGDNIDSGCFSNSAEQASVLSATASAIGMRCIVPLKRFVDTYFACNINSFFGDTARIEIYINPQNRVNYLVDNVDLVTNNANSAGACTLSNIVLNLAIEQNADNNEAIRHKFNNGGLQVLIPYPVAQTTNLGNGTIASISQTLTPGHGLNWLRSYTTIVNTGDANAMARNTDNVNAHKVSTIQSMIGVHQLQDRPINCSQGQDYLIQMRNIERSAYPDGERSYKKYWVWIDQHQDSEPLAHSQSKLTLNSGFPLIQGTNLYQIELNKTAHQHTAYTWSVCQQLISISPSGTKRVA